MAGGPGDTDDQSENTEAGSVRQVPSKAPAEQVQPCERHGTAEACGVIPKLPHVRMKL